MVQTMFRIALQAIVLLECIPHGVQSRDRSGLKIARDTAVGNSAGNVFDQQKRGSDDDSAAANAKAPATEAYRRFP